MSDRFRPVAGEESMADCHCQHARGTRCVFALRIRPSPAPDERQAGLRPADIDYFDQRIEANAQRPSIAGYQALVTDLRAALAAQVPAHDCRASLTFLPEFAPSTALSKEPSHD